MIPQDMHRFGPVAGDCYRAAIASIFEQPTSSLPADLGWVRWVSPNLFQEWMNHCGFDVRFYHWPNGVPAKWPGPTGYWHILGGRSPREGAHATVGMNGRMIFDPHPSRAGLIGVQRDADIFLPRTRAGAVLLRRPMPSLLRA